MTKVNLEEARRLLSYCPSSGILTWKVDVARNVKAGRVAGYKQKNPGYTLLSINGKNYMAHRLAWLIYYGSWPKNEIDHINGKKSDNRIKNLRDCTHQENLSNTSTYANNSSGVKGVGWDKKNSKWKAMVKYKSKIYYFGLYEDIEEAATAVRNGREKLHGEFANHGGFNEITN
jgi:hypothetical protein